jgi:TolA-binding protein
MNMQGRPGVDESVERLVELARDAPAKHLTPQEWAGLHRLERVLLVGERRGHGLKIAAALAFAAAAVVLVLRLRDRALTYEVTDATVSEGGYIATERAEARVRFSDRSELGVGPGTRFRVSGLEIHGGHVMLESGTLHARIHRDPHTAWSLDAGPYVVHVTGTEFDLAWRADDQTLDLRLREGSVVVEGPLADAGVRVHAGQHLVANGSAGTLSLVDEQNGRSPPSDDAHPPPAPAPSGTPALAAAPVDAPNGSRPRETGAASRGRSPEMQSWPARVGHGDFDGVIADAERRGIDRSIAESTVSDLAALADAARYARREDLARRALTAQRARYPGSMQARDASFFLGGLAEGQKNDAASLQWYEAYLGENTDGAYASQALGRKMMLVQRMQGPDAARPVAIEYLARFPDGPYASAAHKLLPAP